MHNYRSRNRVMPGLAIVAGLFLLLAGGYYLYWRYVAAELSAGVENWVVEQRTLGHEVDFAWSGVEGFPFAFRAEFRQPALHFRWPGLELAWRGADLAAEMSPWNLREIRLASAGEHSLRQQPARLHLVVEGFKAQVALFGDGALREVAAQLAQPDIMLPEGVAVAAEAANLRLTLPDTPPADYSQSFAALALEVSRMVLPSGRRLLTTDPVEHAAVDLAVMGPVAMPAAQAARPPLTEILAGWRDAGGDIEVKSFSFAQGPLGLSGEATLALDGNLQPLGAGTVTASGLTEAVEILLVDGLIPPDRALVARTTAKALERTGADGKREAKFALSLQNGVLSFGPAPLMQVPPIEWP